MFEDIYESGECTDDGLSTESIEGIERLGKKSRNRKRKHKKKKKEKFKNLTNEISKIYSLLKNQYFNPYIYQRIKTKKFSTIICTRTRKLLTDLPDFNENRKKNNQTEKIQEEPRFSIHRVNLQRFEYLSYISFSRNDCYSPDPNNPIKISIIKTTLPHSKCDMKLENYFDIDKTKLVVETFKPNFSDDIDVTENLQELLLKFGISSKIVDDLSKILSNNMSIKPTELINTDNNLPTGNDNYVSDDDMDISDNEFENTDGLDGVIETTNHETNNLSEMRKRNSLYMADYSPEHISYHEFVTRFCIPSSTDFWENSYGNVNSVYHG